MRTTAQWYRTFAEQVAAGSPVYAEWATGVAGDDGILALIDELPEQKRQPPLILAVARMLGAADTDWPAFRTFLEAHWPAVAREGLVRPMQSNEPRRCAALLPALAQIAGPIALLEVGASAGLCLYPDRFSYLYRGSDDRGSVGVDSVRLDPAAGPSAVLLECATTGAVPIPTALPEIVWRAGIDLRPLDAADPADAAWLEALVWPGQHERLARVREASLIVRQEPPLLLAGDAAERLGELAGAAPAGATLVVVTAGVLVYIPFARRTALVEQIRALDARWLSLEGEAVLETVRQRLPEAARGEAGAPTASGRGGRFVLALDEHPLAFAGPHGESLDWL